MVDGVEYHPRTLYSKHWTSSISKLISMGFCVENKLNPIKHKFIYLIDKSLVVTDNMRL